MNVVFCEIIRQLCKYVLLIDIQPQENTPVTGILDSHLAERILNPSKSVNGKVLKKPHFVHESVMMLTAIFQGHRAP